jgi:hypothetical protein
MLRIQHSEFRAVSTGCIAFSLHYLLRLCIILKLAQGKAHNKPIGKVHMAIERILEIDANPYSMFIEYCILAEFAFGFETITVKFIICDGV